MTDNEKRAHDLAVAVAVASTFSTSALSEEHTILSDTGERTLFLYDVYKSTYDSVLLSLDRDFPDGK